MYRIYHIQDRGHDGRVFAVPEERVPPCSGVHADGRLQDRQSASIQTLPGKAF